MKKRRDFWLHKRILILMGTNMYVRVGKYTRNGVTFGCTGIPFFRLAAYLKQVPEQQLYEACMTLHNAGFLDFDRIKIMRSNRWKVIQVKAEKYWMLFKKRKSKHERRNQRAAKLQ